MGRVKEMVMKREEELADAYVAGDISREYFVQEMSSHMLPDDIAEGLAHLDQEIAEQQEAQDQ